MLRTSIYTTLWDHYGCVYARVFVMYGMVVEEGIDIYLGLQEVRARHVV